jgi:ATP-dependent DNA helicase RecQ
VIPPTYLSALAGQFGIRALRPAQRQVLEAVCAGAHVLAVLPTGAGKSLCFQLPAALDDGLTLCISPLIALMRDQVLGLRRRGIGWAGAAHSLLTERETARLYGAVREGRCRLLYVAPERLRSAAFREAIEQRGVHRLVIDEAHCLSAWGHDFRADYRLLPSLWQALGQPQVLAFTATAGPDVRRDLRDVFPGLQEILTPINRPRLRLRIKEVGYYGQRERYLARMCEDGGAAIVYATSRRDCEQLAAALADSGIRAAPYHAGLTGQERNAAQQGFIEDRIQVIVATTAFGMGVDKHDIRQVIHAGVPFGVEHYWQEVGRAGRDGKTATATLLWSDQALERTMNVLERDLPSAEHFRCAWRAAEQMPGLRRADFEQVLERLMYQERLGELDDSLRAALLGPLYHAGALVVDMQGGHHPGPKSAWKNALQIARRRERLRRASLDALARLAEAPLCRVMAVAGFLQLPADPCGQCDNCRSAGSSKFKV